MIKKLVSLIFVLIIAASFSACDLDNKADGNGVIVPVTKIANDFANQLPEFDFSNEIVESYKESLRYSFSVECSGKESEKYIKAVQKEGFTEGYPESAPVSGNGYYKASNAEKYMIEIVYKSGVMTVIVTRP